jgi:NAD(P)H dehydrogenase (quinone)
MAAQHTNVIKAARVAGVSRILYTSMLNADDSTSPLAAEHRDTERALRNAGVPFTLLRNGYYTEVYTDPLGQYLENGEILGISGNGKISAATRQDYATAAIAALLHDEGRNRTYELGGPAFDISELARVISKVTGTKMTYHDLPPDQYARVLQQTGMDQATARFVAALDTSIAHGDLETSSADLAHLLGRPATPMRSTVTVRRTGPSAIPLPCQALYGQLDGRAWATDPGVQAEALHGSSQRQIRALPRRDNYG